ATSCREPLAKNLFFAGIVHHGPEHESATIWTIGNRPTGERARNLDDILLRVATIDAECVQFHQLACVVLVETTSTRCLRHLWPYRRHASIRHENRLATVCTALPVIEVVQHGGTSCHRAKQ